MKKVFLTFSDLQNWRSEADGRLVYYLFDILWFEGTDLMNVPLKERREILHAVAPKEGIIKVSENFECNG